MLIVDGHLDLALNAIKENRDLLVNVWTTRVRESHETAKGKGKSTVSLDTDDLFIFTNMSLTSPARTTTVTKNVGFRSDVIACGEAGYLFTNLDHLTTKLMTDSQRGRNL